MVPHVTVEQKITEAFGWGETDVPSVVVTSIDDATKGEALVLLTTRPVDSDDLRTRLLNVGLPNLWIPRVIRVVDKIPILGTGKLDLRGCRDLAARLST